MKDKSTSKSYTGGTTISQERLPNTQSHQNSEPYDMEEKTSFKKC